MEKKFRRGDVVWAKVRGFPWWPAMVKGVNTKITKDEDEDTEVKETLVLVYFIGDDSHSSLPLNKVEKFSAKLEEYSKTKKKTLLTSIELAKKIISGEIPFEKHLQYAKKRRILKKLKQKEVEENKPGEEEESNRYSYEEFKNVFMKKESLDIVSEGGSEISPQKFIGHKKRRSVGEKSSNYNSQIDFRVKEDLSKNIKINININVNNNTNNTVNITTIGGNKIIPEDFVDSQIINNQLKKNDKIITDKNILDHSEVRSSCTNNKSWDNENSYSEIEEDQIEISKEQLVEAVSSLLFYKIDMPTSSSNKSILNSLELIQTKLNTLKNCNIYTLIKDLIPILTSFLSHKNQFINTRSSELISIIKEKVLLEIFDFENEKDEMNKFLQNPHSFVNLNSLEINDDYCKNLKTDIEKQIENLKNKIVKIEEDTLLDMRYKRNRRAVSTLLEDDVNFGNVLRRAQSLPITLNTNITNILPQNSLLQSSEINLLTKSESDQLIEQNVPNKANKINHLGNEETNFESPNNNKNILKLSALNKREVPAFNSYQMKLLFKDYITEDNENSDFKETLNNGIYSENFYQNIYNKYNGLSESLANKRKHVCLKLLTILKLILPQIDTETLKKTIIFIEYTIRTKDPTLGNIYKKKLENFYDKIKDILSITTESINLNIKLKTR